MERCQRLVEELYIRTHSHFYTHTTYKCIHARIHTEEEKVEMFQKIVEELYTRTHTADTKTPSHAHTNKNANTRKHTHTQTHT